MTRSVKTFGVAVVAAISLLGGDKVAAQDKAVTSSNAWVRLPAEGQTSTIAVAAINNPGMYAIYVLTATSDAAGKVEFRDASKGNQAVEEVDVLAYESTYMDPKGIHMYLSDLKRPLKQGNVDLSTNESRRLLKAFCEKFAEINDALGRRHTSAWHEVLICSNEQFR